MCYADRRLILFTSLTILLDLMEIIHGLPSVVKLGALLSPDQQSEEMILNVAIEKINRQLSELGTPTSLVAQIQYAEDFDTFNARRKVCNLTKSAVSAIIGPSSEIGAIYVSKMCDAFNIPHMETNYIRKLKETKHSLDFFPDPLSLIHAYVDLIFTLGWRKFAVVYDDSLEVVFVEHFLKLVEARSLELELSGQESIKTVVTVFQFDDNKPYRDTFWKLQTKNIRNVLLHVKTENLETIFKQAQQVGSLTPSQSYVITSLDLHTIDLDNYKFSKSHILYFSIINDQHPELSNLMYDWASYARDLDKKIAPPLTFKTSTILMMDALKHFQKAIIRADTTTPLTIAPKFDERDRCEDVKPWKQGETVVNQMLYVETAGISGRVRFDPLTRKRIKVMLYLHKLNENGLIMVGNWSDTGLLAEDLSKNLEQQTNLEHSLEGKKLVVSTFLNEPFTMMVQSKDKLVGNARFEGYAVDVIQSLSEYLGFTYKIVINEDEKSGKRNQSTGLWNGLVGDVLYKRADIGIVDMTMTTDRQEVIDFTQPFMATGIAILYRKPAKAAFSATAFLDPFSEKVWIAVMCLTVFFSFAKHVIGRFSPYEWVNTLPCRREENLVENGYNVRNSFWFTTGSLLQQGSDLAPHAVSTRWIAAVWYFFTLILSQSYTANLAAFLTVEIFPHDFNNAQELLKSEIEFGCVADGSTYSFFSASSDPVFSQMGDYLKKHKSLLSKTSKDGITRVMEDNQRFAFLMEGAAIDYITQRNCTLEQVGPRLNDISYAIAIQKGSPYLKALDDGILKLKETGKLDRFYTKWWKEKRGAKQCIKKASSQEPLSLDSVGGVFIVLMVGFLVSIAIALTELIYFSYTHVDTSMSTKDKIKDELKFAFDFRIPTKTLRKGSSETIIVREVST